MAKLIQSDLDHCLDVTRRGKSNLWFVGRSLPGPRRAMFASAYASMRVVDDFVDDEFLVLPDDERLRRRSDAHKRVDGWLTSMEAAICGNADPAKMEIAFPDPRIQRAVAACFDGGDIGPGPWQLLARSMHRDIDETPFGDWDDFIDYCEGATVAPASIFLYVIAADLNGPPSTADRLPAQAADCVRDMAIFCYLVHIARDIIKDAAAGPALLTIPDDVLHTHGLTRTDLAGAVRGGSDRRLRDLISDLAARAGDYRLRGEGWRDRLMPLLGLRERAAFGALMTVYGALHDRLKDDPGFALDRDPEQREELRRSVLAAADIPF
ncbi:squalene/phytoene synthase family protein [Hwanghaeella sp.]|uniref:squalene/phytoene synthase family protein n=1 Tax=Hwanghaeella sp. TaxID=2605943 RepID=UPI003CCC3AFF